MDLQELQAIGAFVDASPVQTEVTWELQGTPYNASVFVVRQPFGVVESVLADSKQDRSHGAKLISLCIRLGKDASEQLTYEQAYNLHPAVAWALVGAINTVNTPKR